MQLNPAAGTCPANEEGQTGMKTCRDNLQTWSGTWWAEPFSPPLRPDRAWDSSSQGGRLMRNFVSLASQAMRWGSEGWWGENTFSASKGLSGSGDPARRPVLNGPSSAGEAVCLLVVVATGQYLQSQVSVPQGKKKTKNSLSNQKWFHLSRKRNAPPRVPLWLRGWLVFIWDIDHSLIYSLVQNCGGGFKSKNNKKIWTFFFFLPPKAQHGRFSST